MGRPPKDPEATTETKVEMPSTGMDAIRAKHPDALRIWTVKGPKEPGGVISGVMIHAEKGHYRELLLRQHTNGSYSVYERVELQPSTDA